MIRPAAPLDLEPPLYRGLGATTLLRTLIASALVWFIPAVIAGTTLADGFAAFLCFTIVLLCGGGLTTFVTASAVRKLQRGRPHNWINRALVSRLPAQGIDLIRHSGSWSP